MRLDFQNKERRSATEPTELADFQALADAAHERYLIAAGEYHQAVFGEDWPAKQRREGPDWPSVEPALRQRVDAAHAAATAALVTLNNFQAAKAAERQAAGGPGPFARALAASEQDRRRRLRERLAEIGVAAPGEAG